MLLLSLYSNEEGNDITELSLNPDIDVRGQVLSVHCMLNSDNLCVYNRIILYEQRVASVPGSHPAFRRTEARQRGLS